MALKQRIEKLEATKPNSPMNTMTPEESHTFLLELLKSDLTDTKPAVITRELEEAREGLNHVIGAYLV